MKTVAVGVLVEEQIEFTLNDLSRACRVERQRLVALVEAGVLEPTGDRPDDWRFEGASLRRARTALRLGRDFELDASATALVLDLLDEIETLRGRLQRYGG
ncbi:MAG TPA: chaperone modulator CbpM [Burkholderiaceae bacterium]|nr:chaperone modulator CbpM [Burkholderiaceae bacterium]